MRVVKIGVDQSGSTQLDKTIQTVSILIQESSKCKSVLSIHHICHFRVMNTLTMRT